METDKNKEPNQNDKKPKQNTCQMLKQKWMDGNVLSKLAISLSMVAVVLSCVSAFSNEFNITNPSFPLGVLSLLVTVLIGWQIFTALGIKKEIKDATERMREENQVLNSRLDAFEKASNKKIDELKSEQGILKLSHSSIELNKECGRAEERRGHVLSH